MAENKEQTLQVIITSGTRDISRAVVGFAFAASAAISDVTVLMVAGEIDSTFTWGWALSAGACELQVAVAAGELRGHP